MSLKNLLDQKATIYQIKTDKDDLGIVGKPTLISRGVFPCAVTRQGLSLRQESPEPETGTAYRLYFSIDAPVEEGDIAAVPGIGRLRLAAPYKPRGHHIEVDGHWEGEA